MDIQAHVPTKACWSLSGPAATLIAIAALSAAIGGSPARAAERLDPATAAHVAHLEAAVQAEESVRAVKRLQSTYGYYLDAGLWDDATDLFTADAVAEIGTTKVSGKTNIGRYLMEHAGRSAAGLAHGQLNAHLIVQPIVTLGADGKTAKGTWHEVAMLGHFGSDAAWRGGIYENDYAIEDGAWKIAHLKFFEQYAGGYDDFGLKAPPQWNIAYPFEAAHVGVTIPSSALAATDGAAAAAATGRSAGAEAAALTERVQRLADETAVRNLVHSYGYYLDRKLWDDVADLYADGGSFEFANRGVYLGAERIRRALAAWYGPAPLEQGELFDHVMIGTVVTIGADGRTAGARTAELAMLGRNGQWAKWQLGVYENELVKQDGVWKLAAVRYYPRLTTDYDRGWAHDAERAPRPSVTQPPNRPPSEPYRSYPDPQPVGFHYLNPATARPVRYAEGAVVETPPIKVAAERRTPRGGASGAALDAELAALERRLDAEIAVDAVENLNSSYGYYLDESNWDGMADTFAASSAGAKEVSGAGVYLGRERIRAVLNLRGPRGGRRPTFFTIHQLLQPVIHVAADGQSAKARFRLLQGGGNADGSSGAWIGGIYENTAVKENGEWKFGAQDLTHTFNATVRGGWARVGGVRQLEGGVSPRDLPPDTRGSAGAAAAGPRIATEMPPDRPIRARQYAFPEIVEPAFHYANPVSGRMPAELLP